MDVGIKGKGNYRLRSSVDRTVIENLDRTLKNTLQTAVPHHLLRERRRERGASPAHFTGRLGVDGQVLSIIAKS